MSFLKHPRWVALFIGVLGLCLPASNSLSANVLPDAPDGLILDEGKILLPERAAELSERLVAMMRERGISIYVVTVPSLGVPPSIQHERLSNLAHLYVDRWLQGLVGVVFLVDDESQAAIIVASAEADRQFPPLRRKLLMKDPLQSVQREKFLRDKVERTTLVIVDVLSGLQDEAKRAARRDRMVNTMMAVIACVGLLVVILARGKNRTAAASS